MAEETEVSARKPLGLLRNASYAIVFTDTLEIAGSGDFMVRGTLVSSRIFKEKRLNHNMLAVSEGHQIDDDLVLIEGKWYVVIRPKGVSDPVRPPVCIPAEVVERCHIHSDASPGISL